MKQKRKIKKSFLKEQYSLSLNYLRESSKFVYISIGIFFLFAILGYFFPVFFKEEIIKFIQELINQTKDMGQLELTRFIFLNNLQSSFLGLFFGLLFGIFPIAVAIVNGYVLGFVSSITIGEEGFLVLWRLLPHGIFELPAVFISLGLGLKLGSFVFRKGWRGGILNSFRVFVFIVMPLLIIAAIIEGGLIYFIR
ncbi:MAG: stage II sporulation protein M [Nanoarchaeota archaeon]|nr:stage II sporulation protein M [Nanoarchaeota archaeon]